MRILVVAMANSVHTTRWLEQFDENDDIQILVLPSMPSRISFSPKWKRLPLLLSKLFKVKRGVLCQFPISKVNTVINLTLKAIFKDKWKFYYLTQTIKFYKPDIIHSLEFQSAGYLCLKARKKIGASFPTWIATNWGSDIYLFRHLKDHHATIKEILSLADFYSAECQRDYDISSEIGMRAKPLPVIPNSGGLHLNKIDGLRSEKKTSQRDLIMVKGYQMVFGRTLNILKSLEEVMDVIKEKNYRLCFFSVTADISLSIELFAEKYALDVEIIPLEQSVPHEQILARQANARCYIGASISDGISTSMLESMAMGAFPIQTCTSCANEWVENGITGFIPECDDISGMASMIKIALTNDDLVDKAAQLNWDTICKRADYKDIAIIAHSFYQTAYNHEKSRLSNKS
ncbi:MAG: glycosyltransferase [Alphaproteobacteria bacterium]|nr:glycosyltransferase [Alphaproteobacteria bacterium]NCQ87669.1 glycosyltransferase [Alphaproteobacteria bacterium]NCT05822.1 glycosyltransferase [Alphaproteobacteria bacterium]